jgi:signal transduction histidine kinase
MILGRIRSFFGSMAGHIFLLLTIGMSVAAIVSLLVAERARTRDFARVRLERVAASVADIAERLRQNPAETQRMLDDRRIMGAYLAPPGIALTTQDSIIEGLIQARLGAASRPEAGEVPVGLCFPKRRFDPSRRAAGIVDSPMPDCWIVRFTDAEGVRQSLAIDLPKITIPSSSTLDPIYLLLIVGSSAALSILVARLAATPLRRLESAAQAFSVSLDPEPIPERGPDEVRAALATFNLMQRRVTEGFRDRTQLLAAISHDLQTPLTRLRLRIEQVPDEALRDRLVSDLSATQALVREGLDLASSSETSEEWSIVDIDSLLASLAEDASEFGGDVRFLSGCNASIRVKPNALIRCVTNLIDNAVKYAGSADVSCHRETGKTVILVRDRGPGIPEEKLEKMFEPFTRGNPSQAGGRSGTGIGLTIARSLAASFGAVVKLSNHKHGGILATVEITDSHRLP